MLFKIKSNDLDPELIKAAMQLEKLLVKYSKTDETAKFVLSDLKVLIGNVIKGDIDIPLKRVPRGYDFHEGELRQYSELEEAYSYFSTKLKGY